ncbi:hypothetical protein CARUB_v10015883mg [Capsella rubella]|uniref:Myb-like domain-containing protein n=1 Tax=Capsella rubella TaxID=81985 RepID=R0I3S2_9BRAS|nr:trihelix transcription factor PTL [Capsella rubella]EOA32590.1 hypothetical protein CARUB_v10015883mg [Capsella rubella]
MEDHHHQNHQVQYGIAQPSLHFSSDLFGFNLVSAPDQHHRPHLTDHEISFLPRGIQGLTVAGNNSNSIVASTSCARGGFSGFTDGGGTGRWPRQETLMLLEVRSRLDHKFKESNQKGPLWDEVSRIMSEEHGYTRSGKKCREKFENLYKYYKKTKEGKAGRRQDGKNYRFFRQLEAIYGESKDSVSCYDNSQFIMTNALHSFHAPNIHHNAVSHIHQNPLSNNTQSLSISNNLNSSSELDISSSSEGNVSTRSEGMNWKAKIKEFIGIHIERLIEKQDFWLEKLVKTVEDKEHQRMVKEEEWKRVEAARIEKERSLWTKERERMEARDVAVIEALQYLTGKALIRPNSSSPTERINGNISDQTMADEENKSKMEKKIMSKKRKEKWSSHGGNQLRIKENTMMIYDNQEDPSCDVEQGHHEGYSPSNSKEGNPSCGIAMAASTNCFPMLVGDGDQNSWEGYGLKLRKEDNHQ